ncbi:MAG: radical SAM protein [Candidatus Desulfofervidus auxilii]|nr:radical SAM protein [Candidatus Desulfofervidus auxilii]
MGKYIPRYVRAYEDGSLEKKIEEAYKILEKCTLCPRECKVNRLKGEKGICKTGELPIVSSFFAHFGEEDPLVGKHGSGTIFISRCNLLCMYCQNYEISHLGEGREITLDIFAQIMLSLQEQGCHNINIVTPTHVVPQLLGALKIAVERGLSIPLVYNTSGYDKVETLKILDGIVDIYMPDFKYWDPKVAKRYSKAPDYPEVARKALKEMHRQVGDLRINEQGIAEEGLLVRHLVLPHGLANTKEIMEFIANEISPNTYVNVMAQYRPCGEAYKDSYLNRSLTLEEYEEALKAAIKAGITRLDEAQKRFLLRFRFI